jgi:hypothetical protein
MFHTHWVMEVTEEAGLEVQEGLEGLEEMEGMEGRDHCHAVW